MTSHPPFISGIEVIELVSHPLSSPVEGLEVEEFVAEELLPATVSPHAARIAFLREQAATLQDWLTHWPESWAKRYAAKKKTRTNLETVERILRELAGRLIAGEVK